MLHPILPATAFFALALSVAGCDGGEAPGRPAANPALSHACAALHKGDWAGLSHASHDPAIRKVTPVESDPPTLPPGGTLEDYFDNVGLFGNAFANPGYHTVRPPGWTDADMRSDAARALMTAWWTCAREIDQFPAKPSARLRHQVTTGAVKLAPGTS